MNNEIFDANNSVNLESQNRETYPSLASVEPATNAESYVFRKKEDVDRLEFLSESQKKTFRGIISGQSIAHSTNVKKGNKTGDFERVLTRAEILAEIDAKEASNSTSKGKRGRPKKEVKPMTGEEALALLHRLADAQGVSIDELQKQLADKAREDAKKRYDELQQKFSDAIKAVKDHEAKHAGVFAEHKSLMEASNAAAQEMNECALAYGFGLV